MSQQKETTWLPADDVNRAKAIVKTAWLALMSNAFCMEDVGDVADTIFEALKRLERAEENMGIHK